MDVCNVLGAIQFFRRLGTLLGSSAVFVHIFLLVQNYAKNAIQMLIQNMKVASTILYLRVEILRHHFVQAVMVVPTHWLIQRQIKLLVLDHAIDAMEN
jgi:hypothetical protein